MDLISPGQWLGMLGGGQLGRMFCAAAQAMGYKVCVLDPDVDSPAGAVADQHLRAGFMDAQALQELAARVRAVSTEFENVPAAALTWLGKHVRVSPDAGCVAIAQDRIAEKQFLSDAGVAVAPWHAITDPSQLSDPAVAALLPGILKSARMGYDGKGQVRVADAAALAHAWERLRNVPCVLEQALQLDQELSVVVCRGHDGATATYPVAENLHVDGILALTTVPARVDQAIADLARQTAEHIAKTLGYVGVMCVEFFLLQDRRLLANEIAPRPHNSGHWSIDACATSQFEQQARVMAGLPLGSTRQLSPAVMINLMGDLWFESGKPREIPWDHILTVPQSRLHLYGKREARPGRKMGHVTVLGQTQAEARRAAETVVARLGISLPHAALSLSAGETPFTGQTMRSTGPGQA